MSFKLRELELPAGVPGCVFLSHMPGRRTHSFGALRDSIPVDPDAEAFAEATAAIVAHGITQVVCLNPDDEIARGAPAYHAARIAHRKGQSALPWRCIDHAIIDHSVPFERERFVHMLDDLVESVTSGARILIHCYAGVGRTGTTAAALLLKLGRPLDLAVSDVRRAGSHAESSEQDGLLRWLAKSNAR